MVDDLPVEVLPVVQPRAAESLFVDSKAERADKPEFGAERNTRPADRSGVGGDFRLMKDNVQAGRDTV